MASSESRRTFLHTSAALAASIGLPSFGARASRCEEPAPLFSISLAQWSLHRTIRSGELDPLDFARVAREEFSIEAIEYVNQFFFDKAEDQAYLTEMRTRAEDQDVRSLLIMCDRLGDLGAPSEAERIRVVENHFPWVEAAKFLGCHSIRVNARSSGSYDEQRDLAADGLGRLSEFAATHEMNVIVENHGGLSSNGQWIADVMQQVDLENCGTLPDFGNFDRSTDRYEGVSVMMPFAKAISAKTHRFDDEGNEVNTDYRRMMQIVIDAGYRGYVGIEWEGRGITENQGIAATQRLLETVRTELS